MSNASSTNLATPLDDPHPYLDAYIAAGASNEEIAERLPHTIEEIGRHRALGRVDPDEGPVFRKIRLDGQRYGIAAVDRRMGHPISAEHARELDRRVAKGLEDEAARLRALRPGEAGHNEERLTLITSLLALRALESEGGDDLVFRT